MTALVWELGSGRTPAASLRSETFLDPGSSRFAMIMLKVGPPSPREKNRCRCTTDPCNALAGWIVRPPGTVKTVAIFATRSGDQVGKPSQPAVYVHLDQGGG